jgi:hypothetical protein
MCRRVHPVQAPACYCGHKFRTQFPTAVPDAPPVVAAAPPPASAPIYQNIVSHGCPVCGNHDVAKVTAVLGDGNSITQNKGYSIGGGHVFGGPNFVMGSINRSTGISATELAQRLAPPLEPRRQIADHTGTVLTAFAGIMFLAILGITLPAKLFGPSIAIAVIGLALVAIAIWLWQVAARTNARFAMEHAQNVQHWQMAMNHWNTLYYCGKCDSVHRADTGQSAPSHSMPVLL